MAATLIGLTGIAARAQSDAEVEALLVETLLSPEWDAVLGAGTGAGFKDNIFLSHADPTGRPFVTAAAELLVLRYAPLGVDFNFYGNAEARNFFGGGVSHQEFTAFSQTRMERQFGEVFTGSLSGQYFYQDQVLDISVTETNREAAPVLGHTFVLKPALRAELPWDGWAELEPSATRQLFEAPLDDYWEAGVELTLGRKFGNNSHVKLSYEPLWRPYDSDFARASTGDALTNTLRFSFRQEARLTWEQHWDPEDRWQTELMGGVRINEENGEGYADYTRWFATARIQYQVSKWEILAEGRFAYYRYHNQTISASSAIKRNRTEWGAVCSFERELAEKVIWVTRYEYETTLSNDPLETYNVNTISTGLRWEF